MIKFEDVVTPSPEQWKATIMGARNPLNSWNRSDSKFHEDIDFDPDDYPCGFKLGPNDYDLLKRLRNAGTADHRKFMRMLPVMVTITAPLYWWKEFSTYKVGTVANSCSTMHKIADKEFTLEDFSHEHLIGDNALFIHNKGDFRCISNIQFLMWTIDFLNENRRLYLETSDELKKVQESYRAGALDTEEKSLKIRELQKKKKQYWWQMIQLLPSSYNQKRTVMMNYEVLANIYKSRKHHKLDEWAEHNPMIIGIDTDEGSYSLMSFCDWIKTLPYAELICGEHINKEETTPNCFVPIPGDK